MLFLVVVAEGAIGGNGSVVVVAIVVVVVEVAIVAVAEVGVLLLSHPGSSYNNNNRYNGIV
ncbi:hypothetical protein DPMN_071860 [Dreissena polymorpha]|uniref:Uncharacterized protein n=1 Tax=Dreissena polymorpha TaxID=45954 RepID=A0A9D3Z7I7_DREPO|nr:hypothetical protein DPMN_071860 [Dreissena polymorpha]